MNPRVSVVVPIFKRPELLERCLDALQVQDFDAQDYEIIIVDDADCAETQQQVMRRAEKAQLCGHTIRYIPVTSTCSHGPCRP